MSSANRRVIQDDSDSDSDPAKDPPQPIQADHGNPAFVPSTLHAVASSSPLSSYLVLQNDDEYHLNKELHEEFIQSIRDPAADAPSSTSTTTTEHEILLVVEALRRSEKKARIRLFKHNKAHVVFGAWWDYCLAKLRDDDAAATLPSDSTVSRIVLALLRFVRENMADVIKTGGDLAKAKAKWGVDLTGYVQKTNECLLRLSSGGERDVGRWKEEMASVMAHCKEVWGVDVVDSPSENGGGAATVGKNPTSSVRQSVVSSQAANAGTASADPKDAVRSEADRKEAAALARLEAMRNQRSRRFGPTTMGAHPPARGTSRNDTPQCYGKKPAPESNSGNHARHSNDAPISRSHAGSAWERGSSSAPHRSSFSERSNGDAGWGRSSSSHAAAGSSADNGGWGNKTVSPANVSDGWGKPPSTSSMVNKAMAPGHSTTANNGQASASGASAPGDGWGRASSSGAAPTKSDFSAASSGHSGDGWSRSAPSSNVAAATSSSHRNSASGTNDGWGRTAPSSNVAASSGHGSDGWDKRSLSSSKGASATSSSTTNSASREIDGWGRPAPSSNVAAATQSNNGAASNSHGSDGWGTAPATINSASGNDDGWGSADPSSNWATATQSNQRDASNSHVSDGWGKSIPSSTVAPATGNSASGNDDGWGRTAPSSNVAAATQSNQGASSGHGSDGWGKITPSSTVAAATGISASGNDDGWGRTAPSSNVAAATRSNQGASSGHGSDGWGKSTPSSTVAAATMNSASGSNDGWGRTASSSNVAAATQSNQRDASCGHGSDGWSKSTPSSTMAPAAINSASGSNDGWGRTGSSTHSAAATLSTAKTSVTGNNDEWSRPRGGEIPPYSGSNKSSSNVAYDSLTKSQPYPPKREEAPLISKRLESYNSSDHNSSPRGGDIRNNQPLGSAGYRNNDKLQQQSDSYALNRDEYQSRQSSYDRRDSRSSYQSRSSDGHHEDRRKYDDRRPSNRSSAFRSDSPPSSRDNRYESSRSDDNRDGKDRYVDRARRDRDDSFRRSNAPKRCSYFFSEKGCRSGSKCRFSHDEDDRKTSTDYQNERGGYARKAEEDDRYDRGSEDGEVRPAKRFRGNDNGNLKANVDNFMSAPPPVVGAGRGRGRGANVNLPAWMTNGSSTAKAGPTGSVTSSNNQTTTALNIADLTSSLSVTQGINPSVASAGRGSGRGNVDNRPAWMTRGANGQSGPVGAATNSAAPAVVDRMSGRFAPPSAARKNEIPPQPVTPGMGRGRGRGTDNRPAWMTRGES